MKPKQNLRYYNPVEKPTMYPLELCKDLHVCLWDNEGKYKWTIAYFDKGSEGYDLRFVGDRPFDKRVDWRNLEVVLRQGQIIADKQFEISDQTDKR